MILLMVYWDDDTDKKKRLEQRLMQKKMEREGLLAPAVVHDDSELSSVELNKALDVIDRQSHERAVKDKQIEALIDSLAKTQGLLETAINNNQPGQYQVVNRATEKIEHVPLVDDDMPTLENIDAKIKVIDTSGIEVGKGKVGESIQTGESTKGKANKLKELLKKRGKK